MPITQNSNKIFSQNSKQTIFFGFYTKVYVNKNQISIHGANVARCFNFKIYIISHVAALSLPKKR